MTDPKRYANERIAVLWDSSRCIHTARCLRALPEVFDVGRRPWIAVDAAGPDAVAAAVERCPTGALRHERADGVREQPRRPTLIRPVPDGPLAFTGDIRVEGPDGELLAHESRLTLCRCGLTRNQPFCDNSHRQARWVSGPDQPPAKPVPAPEPAAAEAPTLVTARRDKSLRVTGDLRIWSSATRSAMPAGEAILCRCGRSRHKPFCDGSHRDAGFRSRPAEAPHERLRATSPGAFTPNPGVPAA